MTCQSRSQTTPQCWLTFSSRVSVDWLRLSHCVSLMFFTHSKYPVKVPINVLRLAIWRWRTRTKSRRRKRRMALKASLNGRSASGKNTWWASSTRPPGPSHSGARGWWRERRRSTKKISYKRWQLFQVLPPNCRVLARWAHHRNLGIFGSSGQQPEVMFPKW